MSLYSPPDEDDAQYYIRDEDTHDHFTQIPNIIFDLQLSPYALSLYCVLKRVAGERGKCWMSTKTLATKCSMAVGSVTNA